ncbi:MAG: GntP family permease, partial [Alphaproteobacteria bacterium]|nr:GntP family permease [Alphaproteobacteria bacterium]
MTLVVTVAALVLLMFVAFRGYSVILFAPVAAMLAVVATHPIDAAPIYSAVFMDKMAGFIKLYFPVFLLGAVFGKLIELSGYSQAIVASVIKLIGRERAMLSIVLVCAVLTYGGVSLFVVVFAVYPFAAEMFRQSAIPKRLIPGTIALGAFTFTMDALPGTPQIQNIIPTTFFNTTAWSAPLLGIVGAVFILIMGLLYLDLRRRQAVKAGEGYGTKLLNEPEPFAGQKLPNALLAATPLIAVFVLNRVFTDVIPMIYGAGHDLHLASGVVHTTIAKTAALWAVQMALLTGIAIVLATAFRTIKDKFQEGSKQAVGGSLLAAMNTASEYGFGGVIATLPGFLVIAELLKQVPNPLINEAITVTALAGITGSASGGLSIALATMSAQFIQTAQASGIPLEVMHRIASMASGGMDTLPHNGAVITLLSVT